MRLLFLRLLNSKPISLIVQSFLAENIDWLLDTLI